MIYKTKFETKQSIMKKKFLLSLFVLVGTLFIFSCDEETVIPDGGPPQIGDKNVIMPLGASRVEGDDSFSSYRYDLWKLLVDGQWEFDFIGSMDDEQAFADYNGQSFDRDHEGHGGFTSGQILSQIEGWLDQAGTPDIVLFSSPGGNDALLNLSYDAAIENINAIIDIIQTKNPNVTILIEQLAPAQSELMVGDLATYFMQMNEDVESIAANQSTATSNVIVVDMATGFTDSLLADDVHYNEEGAKFIAERYYNVLENVLEN
jgi:lysophospholipase L1-like esterase